MASRRTLLKTAGVASIASSIGGLANPVGARNSNNENNGAAPKAVEKKRIQQVGYSDLDGRREAFKMGLQEVDGEWYLYLAHFWNSGWSIVNVTDPRNPVYENFITLDAEHFGNTETTQIQVADGLMVTSLETPHPVPAFDPDEPSITGVAIWDVSDDPTDPQHLATHEIDGGGTHRNHYDGGNYVYLAADVEGFDGGIPIVLDISDPENPTEASREWWPGQAPDEEFACPSDEGASFHGPVYPASDENPEIGYLSYGGAGMVTADISDPENIEFVHQFDNGDIGDTGVGVHTAVQHPDTSIVWTSTETTAEGQENMWTWVFGLDKEDPQSDKVLSVLPTPTPKQNLPYDTYYQKGGRFGPHNTHHYQYTEDYYKPDDILPWTWFNAGLRLFDVSRFRAPKEVGYYVPESPEEYAEGAGLPRTELVTQTESVLIDNRGYMYITHKNQGVHILQSDLI